MKKKIQKFVTILLLSFLILGKYNDLGNIIISPNTSCQPMSDRDKENNSN